MKEEQSLREILHTHADRIADMAFTKLNTVEIGVFTGNQTRQGGLVVFVAAPDAVVLELQQRIAITVKDFLQLRQLNNDQIH